MPGEFALAAGGHSPMAKVFSIAVGVRRRNFEDPGKVLLIHLPTAVLTDYNSGNFRMLSLLGVRCLWRYPP